MNWSERLKLAWKTFIREALPLYLWILIYIGVGIVILLVLGAGFLAKNPSLFSAAIFTAPQCRFPEYLLLRELISFRVRLTLTIQVL